MCGIFSAISSNKKVLAGVNANLGKAIDTIKFRGPDRTATVSGDDYIAAHAHLIITGYREQPIVADDFLLLYNGEIYNDYLTYRNSSTISDTDYLIGQINEKGNRAFENLDGEFAICLYLFKSHTLLLASDAFGTKPLYYQLGEDYCIVGSYESTVSNCRQNGSIVRIPANTIIEIDLKNFTIKDTKQIRRFDFSNQAVDTFEKWHEAFTGSILKRTANKKQNYFVSFSSGLDSGLIAAELINSSVPFSVYSSTYMENIEVLNKRLELLKRNKVPCEIMNVSKEEFLAMREYLHKHIEPYQLINEDSDFRNFPDPDMRNLPGYIVYAIIHKKAREDKRLISLSGQGSDEIIADYYNEGSNPAMSEIRGNWENVKGPWKNFFGGWNRVFLGGCERIAGLFGIETRYPFLDVDLVQEFINLDPKLKAKSYKGPITSRLEGLSFPYHLRKQGFAGFKLEHENV